MHPFAHVRRENHEILARNWRTRWCEIDIVSKKGEKYYFTEVKFRKTADFGGGEAAISNKKIEQMKFAAEFFAHKNNLENVEMQLLGAIVEGEDFEIKDISKDREAAMFLVKKTKKMAVPVIQIGEEFIVGYAPDNIKAQLQLQHIIK